MSLATGRRTTPSQRFTAWAWVAAGLTPVVWVLTALLGFTFGGGEDDNGIGAALASLLVNAVALVAPTVALVLALAARRRGERSAGAARAVATVLLGLTLVLEPALVTSFSVAWLAAVLAAGLVLWLQWQRGGSGTAPG